MGPTACVDLSVDVSNVPLNGAHAQEQFAGDLAVGVSAGEQAQHLDLPCGKAIWIGCARFQSLEITPLGRFFPQPGIER